MNRPNVTALIYHELSIQRKLIYPYFTTTVSKLRLYLMGDLTKIRHVEISIVLPMAGTNSCG